MVLPTASGEPIHLGFVDVPGHERFVRNMLAGVGGIDIVLLVIAADESIKPQTREHFDILQLLGVQRGITVLTKSDSVDAETLDVVRLEVEDFLRGTFLEPPNAPIVAVSSLTGAGLDALKAALVATAANVQPRDPNAFARLPIDRVFTMKGFGTVVTGTLISGTIRREEELEVCPSGRRVRVRGIQVHGAPADQAVAGQRTALNLAGANTEELSRGMSLVPPDTLAISRRADARLFLLPSAPRPLKNRTRVHFHCNTMETVAEIHIHDAKQVEPGSSAFVRLKFSQSALALPGDRFIVRQFSPVVTIGGGVVLDAAILPRLSGPENVLQILDAGDRASILQARIQRRGSDGIFLKSLISETGWTSKSIEAALAACLRGNEITRVGDLFVHTPALDHLQLSVLHSLSAFHNRNSLAAGISKEELREQTQASPVVFAAVLDRLAQQKKIEVAGDQVRLPGRGVTLKDEEADSKRTIESAFSTAGLKVPALQEVLAALKIDRARAQKIVTLLLREKVLIKMSDDLVFHRSALENLRRMLASQKAKSPRMDVAKFKELTGVSRKYAIPLLEYLDRERVTRRVGDAREIL
jgi:selenocysteine-specific elongation factor